MIFTLVLWILARFMLYILKGLQSDTKMARTLKYMPQLKRVTKTRTSCTLRFHVRFTHKNSTPVFTSRRAMYVTTYQVFSYAAIRASYSARF